MAPYAPETQATRIRWHRENQCNRQIHQAPPGTGLTGLRRGQLAASKSNAQQCLEYSKNTENFVLGAWHLTHCLTHPFSVGPGARDCIPGWWSGLTGRDRACGRGPFEAVNPENSHCFHVDFCRNRPKIRKISSGCACSGGVASCEILRIHVFG
jgi:hypothetical protein